MPAAARMAQRLQRLLDRGDLHQHVAVGGRIGIGDGVVEDGDFHGWGSHSCLRDFIDRQECLPHGLKFVDRRALDCFASSTRGAALSTIRRINST